MAEFNKKLAKAESNNKKLINQLEVKDTQIHELEEQLNSYKEKFDMARSRGPNDDLEQIASRLLEKNSELKEQLNYVQELFEEKKSKYKLKIEQLENELIDLNKYYEQPNTRLSMKRKADFIKLENDIRQKNLYIDSLLEKIRELQSLSRDNLSNYRARVTSRNDTRNSIDLSRVSSTK